MILFWLSLCTIDLEVGDFVLNLGLTVMVLYKSYTLVSSLSSNDVCELKCQSITDLVLCL